VYFAAATKNKHEN